MPLHLVKPPKRKLAPRKKENRNKDSNSLAEVEKHLAEQQAGLFDIDFTQCTRLSGNVANGDNTDPVVLAGTAELAMRRLIAHFGFDRLPLTWGELNAMLEYCENLWVAAGGGQLPKHVKAAQEAAREVDLEYQAWRVPAFDAYIAGDISKLRAIHTADKTLERIASEWQEFVDGVGY